MALENLNDIAEVWQKYSGLNLRPIASLGTVEYRHLRGNRDVDYILNWIDIILSIHKTASLISFNDLFRLIRTLNTTSAYIEFMEYVFPTQYKNFVSYDLKGLMEYGVSVVKSIALPSKFLHELINNMSNQSKLLKQLDISKENKVNLTKEKLNIQSGSGPILQPNTMSFINDFEINYEGTTITNTGTR